MNTTNIDAKLILYSLKGVSRYPGFDPGFGIRENAKFIDGIPELTVTREAGFAKILAQEAELGKKMVLGLEMTGVRHAELS